MYLMFSLYYELLVDFVDFRYLLFLLAFLKNFLQSAPSDLKLEVVEEMELLMDVVLSKILVYFSSSF